jgi:hypothetical protein
MGRVFTAALAFVHFDESRFQSARIAGRIE